MYTVILTAPSLCLLGQKKEIKEDFKFNKKPSYREVELLQRKFALKYNIELDMIAIDIVFKKIEPLT